MDFPRDVASEAIPGEIRETAAIDRGCTPAGRWVVRTDRGSAFLKYAATPQTVHWLRSEQRFYGAVKGEFVARLLAHGDRGDRAWIVIEDLSGAHWPPPWNGARVEAVKRALASLAAHEGLAGFPLLENLRDDLTGWKRVAADPRPFLSLGLASASWLDRALPSLVKAEAGAELAGRSLLHCDVRSDNLCFVGDRAVLVDWNWACLGNPTMDAAFWAPSLHAEGGPPPEDVVGHEPEFAALASGYFAYNAGLPADPVPVKVRDLQKFQLRTALPWAARALGLATPTT